MNTAAEVAMRDAFGEALLELAPRHPEMVVLDADVCTSTRTAQFAKAYPHRFFNVGAAEANLVDVAAGLATCGLRPVVSTFAVFLSMKAAEQIYNVVCYNRLPVVLAANYAGLSDSFDGASHQCISDLAAMRALPGMRVVVPADAVELHGALAQALTLDGPTYMRICRNPTPLLFSEAEPLPIGRIRRLRAGQDLTLAVCGVPVFMAREAAEQLAREGIQVDLLEVATLKPLDEETLVESARRTRRVLTVEEHSTIGGLGGAVAEVLTRRYPVRLERLGIDDRFAESGEYRALLAKYGISAREIERRAKALVRYEPEGAA